MRTFLVLLLFSGCLGAGVEQEPPDAPEAATGHRVEARNFTFDPPDLNISAGEAVTWVNGDEVDHWITAEDNSFDSGRLPPEARFSNTFNQTGTFPYRCMIHAGMVGSVQVS